VSTLISSAGVKLWAISRSFVAAVIR